MTPNTVCFTRPMPVTNRKCCSHSKVMCPACARDALNRLVVNPAGAESSDVDPLELAKFLGVGDVDPAKDPAGFLRAVVAALDELRAKLTGGGMEPAAPPVDEEVATAVANYFDSDNLPVLDLDALREKRRAAEKRTAAVGNEQEKKAGSAWVRFQDDGLPILFENH